MTPQAWLDFAMRETENDPLAALTLLAHCCSELGEGYAYGHRRMGRNTPVLPPKRRVEPLV